MKSRCCLSSQNVLQSKYFYLLRSFYWHCFTESIKLRKTNPGIPSGKLECIIRNHRKEMSWRSSPSHLSKFSFICCLSLATAKLKVCLYVWLVSAYEDAWMYMHLFIILKMILMLQLEPFLLGFDQRIISVSSEVGLFFFFLKNTCSRFPFGEVSHLESECAFAWAFFC